ncbi:hypothetical protein Y886_12045, partial [Xanthomonas hyacinthi DSM 19077]
MGRRRAAAGRIARGAQRQHALRIDQARAGRALDALGGVPALQVAHRVAAGAAHGTAHGHGPAQPFAFDPARVLVRLVAGVLAVFGIGQDCHPRH